MAFVRWRGNCAQLLVTRWENGKSRQLCLANFHGAYTVPWSVRQAVTHDYPALQIDWVAIEAALAQGPPGSRPLTPEEWDWAHCERLLTEWGHGSAGDPAERDQLLGAAAVLQSWRARRDRASPTTGP